MKLIHRNGSEIFYLRKDVQGNRISISVTNMKSLWRSEMDEDDVLRIFERQNPLVQAKRERIMIYVHSCLDSKESSTSVDVDEESKVLSLSLVNHASEIKVKLNFVLDIQSNQEFFKEVTNPLVAVVTHLLEQRSKLLALVKSKDLELREYKLEGAEISRKNVETDEIMEKEFLSESLDEFLDKVRTNQLSTELNLSPDLLQVFVEATKLKEEVPSDSNATSSSLPVVTDKNGTSSSPAKPESKRPLGNQTIVQVPRAKLRKKNFKL